MQIEKQGAVKEVFAVFLLLILVIFSTISGSLPVEICILSPHNSNSFTVGLMKVIPLCRRYTVDPPEGA